MKEKFLKRWKKEGYLKLVSIMSKCPGCGVELQTEEKEKPGFIPLEKFGKDVLCERCYRMQHYHDFKVISMHNNEEILSVVHKANAFAFFLVDFLNINEETMTMYKNIQIPKCLVISKLDCIPKSIRKEKIALWLKEVYAISEEIHFLSAINGYGIRGMQEILEKNHKKKGYLLGYTNAGKSTLVNRLVEKNRVTTSILPNTTLDFIKIPLEDGYILFDSPGFQYEHVIYDLYDSDFLKKLNTQKSLKPLMYPLKKGMSILIEKEVRIECLSDTCSVVFYMPFSLTFKKVYEKNNSLKDLNSQEFAVLKDTDLVIQGLGFVNIRSDGRFRIFIKDKQCINFRKSMFGGEL